MSILVKLRDSKNLPEAESQIRDYILKNPKSIIGMTCKDLGVKTYTSAATVVRLCKRINSSGFTNLKLLIAQELKVFEEKNMEVYDSTNIKKGDKIVDIIEKINSINVKSVEETSMLMNPETLQKIVDEIKAASSLDIFGIGSSHIVALDATFKFMRIGKNTINFALYDRQYVQALNSNSSHVALLISYSGESEQIIEICKKLKGNFVKTISITSSSENELAKMCDYNLFVSCKETIFRSGAISSRTGTLHVVDILYSAYCNDDFEKNIKRINLTRIE